MAAILPCRRVASLCHPPSFAVVVSSSAILRPSSSPSRLSTISLSSFLSLSLSTVLEMEKPLFRKKLSPSDVRTSLEIPRRIALNLPKYEVEGSNGKAEMVMRIRDQTGRNWRFRRGSRRDGRGFLVKNWKKFITQHCLKPTSPIRSEIEVKLGGTQCNIIMSRLKPWMHLQSSKKKKMVLQDGNSNPERLRSTESKAIMWTCTVSAPEMTIVLYSLSGSPLYHITNRARQREREREYRLQFRNKVDYSMEVEMRVIEGTTEFRFESSKSQAWSFEIVSMELRNRFDGASL
ncbi:hypothetical protein TEA_011109 [Camellia sinensis var. sinensis]|uniref:Uncharacterized protein n=1 Tax=Camellia sinensis var. sinensis TaxID=542762 RepID=A0A4S4E8H2_CAMSN|nr:hypothetical protein TEA_011109 [Camellia sinensis var. sinensis]